MSYYRFSSDNWKSDLYCYESDRGYETHMARNRIIGEVPTVPDLLSTPSDEWAAASDRQQAFLDTATHEPIEHPLAGASFVDPDLASFLARLLSLQEAGFNVPERAIATVREELA